MKVKKGLLTSLCCSASSREKLHCPRGWGGADKQACLIFIAIFNIEQIVETAETMTFFFYKLETTKTVDCWWDTDTMGYQWSHLIGSQTLDAQTNSWLLMCYFLWIIYNNLYKNVINMTWSLLFPTSLSSLPHFPSHLWRLCYTCSWQAARWSHVWWISCSQTRLYTWRCAAVSVRGELACESANLLSFNWTQLPHAASLKLWCRYCPLRTALLAVIFHFCS